MTPAKYLKNKKVLVMGLGLLGGGIATTKWLVKHGAEITVTDLKSRADLAGSIKSLGPIAKKVKFVLGKHDESDFKTNDIVVVNPAVPKESPFLKIARDSGAKLENEATLFFNLCPNPIIAITGTRGKTTTANWIHHFLSAKWRTNAVLAGNSTEHPYLKELDSLDSKTPVVVEISSWHLELFDSHVKAPHIAVITNLYPDHLNRHIDMNDYASAKANIFRYQTEKDFLILNKKNPWTKFYLKQKPISQILYSDSDKNVQHLELGMGDHNSQNLKTSALAANLAGVSWDLIKKGIKTLPQIKFRQEIIYQKNGLTIVNDTTATSPDATVAALKRFSKLGEIILLTGGTSKNLEFDDWAKEVKKFVKPTNLFLLGGSATQKMLTSLKLDLPVYQNLAEMLAKALEINLLKKIILLSPSAASFEKFKNEFDRGEKFNLLVSSYMKKLTSPGRRKEKWYR